MVATTTIVNVYNMALGLLGEEAKVASTSDDTHLVEALNTYFDNARRMTLESHAWNFALKRASLAQNVVKPEYGYAYQYTLPADCLRVIATWEQERGWVGFGKDAPKWGYNTDYAYQDLGYEPYVVENGMLLTDRDEVKIKYVYDQIALTRWSAHAIDALSVMLASKSAFRITGDRQLGQSLLEAFYSLLPDAKNVDAREGTTKMIVRSSFNRARRG